jgi:hypothetical protein
MPPPRRTTTVPVWHIDQASILQGTIDAAVSMTRLTLPDDMQFPFRVVLTSSGCLLDSISDCNRTCSTPQTMFNSWESQWNCLTLAALSAYTYHPWPNATLEMMNLTAINQFTSQVGVADISAFDCAGTTEKIFSCFSDSCNNALGNCQFDSTSDAGSFSFTFDQYLPFLNSPSPLCDNMDNNVNTDLAGPGVSAIAALH